MDDFKWMCEVAGVKQQKPTVFLGGECQTDWRQGVIFQFKHQFQFFDPYKTDWEPQEDIYDQMTMMLKRDYIVFYKGVNGSRHQKKFLQQVNVPYMQFDDLQQLKQYLMSLKTGMDQSGQVFPTRNILSKDGIDYTY